MSWLIVTLCGGIALAAVSIYVYEQDAQQATKKGAGGFESHQVPMYPTLTGLSFCILLACILASRSAHRVLEAFAVLALAFYIAFYVVAIRRLAIRRKEISGIKTGTQVTAETDFEPNRNDLGGKTATGTVSLDGEEFHAFIRTDGLKVLPKKGDRLVVEDTDEFSLIVSRDPDIVLS